MEICRQINVPMRKFNNTSRVKDRLSRRETLPLLRGMFITPGAPRRIRNVNFSELLHDLADCGKPIQSPGAV
jgi:hypothetical protein